MRSDDPQLEARRLISGFRAYQMMVAACRLELPDHVATGAKTASELATATGTHEPSLRRMLRGLAAWGVLIEGADGRFGSTPLSDMFRADRPGLRNMTVMLSGEGYRAWGDLMHTLRTGQPAYPHVFGSTRWEDLANDPAAAAEFNAAMIEMTARIAAGFIRSYDLSGVRSVVDVGGGNGALLGAVLKANPAIRGVLFDLPAGLEGAREKLEKEGVGGRVEIVEGSFFETIPSGADLYLLKSIVHDWDEEHARAILETCRRCMGQDARLVLLERTLPERIDDSAGTLATVMSDLHMMVVLGGRERTPAEYGELLSSAGLRMTRHVAFDAEFGAIEARAVVAG
ncbi:MAG TPA: methyltransferase [Candidatus Dormibacteraeota bacterium]